MGKRALILVDLQKDFCPGGALAVNDGDAVIPVANQLSQHFDLTVATQDWHPIGHGSFASTHGKQVLEMGELDGMPQVMWPDHCVQNSPGAEFHDNLKIPDKTKIVQKGTDPKIDSYSGFFDNGHKKSTGMTEYLRQQGVTDIYVMGLATDYCVKYTALDGVAEGFKTFLIEPGCRGVNVNPNDVDNAVAEMKSKGIEVVGLDLKPVPQTLRQPKTVTRT